MADVFRNQIARTDGGASVAVYHRGRLVVDLWGGVRSPDGAPWTRDTLAMCWSTTKGVTATCAHVLADRGDLDYDERVATYWPEFAQNGKADITVRQVLATLQDRADVQRLRRGFQIQEAGVQSAEPLHTLSFRSSG